MGPLQHVSVSTLHPERFAAVFGPREAAWLRDLIARAGTTLRGRVVWSVSSTAAGGGVAEMLRSLIAYGRGAGVDARWVVIEGDERFFAITKRLHNHLHGSLGDGGALDAEERRAYERTLAANAAELSDLVDARDIVLLHDPQTAGLIEPVTRTSALAIWRAHVGLDLPNDTAREAWSFLRPYVEAADAYVFSRAAFAWEGLPRKKVEVIPPSIDAFSPKNEELAPDTVLAILAAAGLMVDGAGARPTFTCTDGSPGRVDSRAEVLETRRLTPADRIVLQVSRWDRLKDPRGVLCGFAQHVAGRCDAHLVLAGPSVAAVTDDPEGAAVWDEVCAAFWLLPEDVRARVHLCSLPMRDPEQNGAIVNALQRQATVIVQKSLAEGFGLTVSEAMWKGKPVVASRVGGIRDQVEEGVTGILIDPGDLLAFGDAVRRLLEDQPAASRMGQAAQERVRASYLGPRHLGQYFELFRRLLAERAAVAAA
jgi:trehalose synthase